MHGVSGALGDDVAENVVAGEGEIADEVEDLVADKLVVEAQGAVENAHAVENDCAGFGYAANQPHVSELLFVFLEAEGAGRGDLGAIVARRQIDDEALAADGRGEINLVGD